MVPSICEESPKGSSLIGLKSHRVVGPWTKLYKTMYTIKT